MCLSFSQSAWWLACHSQVKAFFSRFADEVEKTGSWPSCTLRAAGRQSGRGKGGGGCHGVVAVLLVSFEGNQRLVTRLGAAHMETVSLSDRESQGNLPFHRLPNTGVFCKACDEPPLAVNVSFVAFTLLAISSDSLVLICCCALCSYSSSTNQ